MFKHGYMNELGIKRVSIELDCKPMVDGISEYHTSATKFRIMLFTQLFLPF